MSYLVMECHPAYAVVLSEDGKFLKVANLNYREGLRVAEVVPMEQPEVRAESRREHYGWVTAGIRAACLCLIAFGALYLILFPYGKVRISINPDVELTVNRLGYVIAAKGLNSDGVSLIADWNYFFEKVDAASGELSGMAADRGYLEEGGTICFSVASGHNRWKEKTEGKLGESLKQGSGFPVTVIRMPDSDDEQDNHEESGKADWDEDDSEDDREDCPEEDCEETEEDGMEEDDREDDREDEREDGREEDPEDDEEEDSRPEEDPEDALKENPEGEKEEERQEKEEDEPENSGEQEDREETEKEDREENDREENDREDDWEKNDREDSENSVKKE